MPHITTARIRTYYERAGDGPRLLYISGTGSDLRATPGIFGSPLAAHCDQLAYDQRGLGQTDIPDGPYTMRDYADDAAALLDAIGWDRCRVLGVSFGGMVAQELAVRHPQRVERMVLACTASGGAGGASYPLHDLDDSIPAAERARRSLHLGDTRMPAIERDDPARFQRFVDFVVKGYGVGAGEPGRERGQRLQLEARSRHDVYDRLPSLTMPVYICGGRYDGIAPPANLEAIARQIPHTTLEFFEGGHLFMVQDRAAYPRMIEFLTAP
jgi:3-oxoadipate enol-lactonase